MKRLTNQEAINELRVLITRNPEYAVSLDMAIEALKEKEYREWISVNKKLPDVNPEKIYVDDDCYYQQSDDVLLLMNKEADRIGYSGKYATAKLCVDDSSIDRGYWSLEERTLGLTWADAWCRIPPDPDQEESI